MYQFKFTTGLENQGFSLRKRKAEKVIEKPADIKRSTCVAPNHNNTQDEYHRKAWRRETERSEEGWGPANAACCQPHGHRTELTQHAL